MGGVGEVVRERLGEGGGEGYGGDGIGGVGGEGEEEGGGEKMRWGKNGDGDRGE